MNGQAKQKGQQSYTAFVDDEPYLDRVVIPAIRMALSLSRRGIVTTGNRHSWKYPVPDDQGVWFNPAGTSRGKWGYQLSQPILFYGKDPRAGKGSTPSSCWGHNDSVKHMKNHDHPCPKPLKFVTWLILKGSLEEETILDPFMGSGTTLKAAKDNNRKAIGIDLEEKYCELAVKRLRQMVLV